MMQYSMAGKEKKGSCGPYVGEILNMHRKTQGFERRQPPHEESALGHVYCLFF